MTMALCVKLVVNIDATVSVRLLHPNHAEILDNFSTWARHGESLFGSKNAFSHDRTDEREFGQQTLEKYYGKRTINKKGNRDSSQWTNKFGEAGVKVALETVLGRELVEQPRFSGCRPDLFDPQEDTIYEVKTQSYTIPGTAGEKIFAVPFKYKKLGKKIVVILAGSLETMYHHLIFPETEDHHHSVRILNECRTTICRASDLIAKIH